MSNIDGIGTKENALIVALKVISFRPPSCLSMILTIKSKQHVINMVQVKGGRRVSKKILKGVR